MRLGPLISGNDSLQRLVAGGREALLVVSPKARAAIRAEILPQVEDGIFSIESLDELLVSTKQAIDAAFSAKTPIYTRLVSYKSIDQSDSQFLEDLLYVMDEWARHQRSALETQKLERNQQSETPVVPSGVNVNVNTGDGSIHNEVSTVPGGVSWRRATEQENEVAQEDDFDLNDVRL